MKTKITILIAGMMALSACGKSDGQGIGGPAIVGSTSKTATSTAALFYRETMKLFGGIENFLMPSAVATAQTHFGSAVSVKLKFFKLWASSDSWCGVRDANGNIPYRDGGGNPQVRAAGAERVLIADFGTDGKEFDLAQNPSIASLENVPPGTYQCLIMETSDRWKMTPDATARAALSGCATDREYTNDVLSPGDSSHFRNIDGQEGSYPSYNDAANTTNDDHYTLYWPVQNTLYLLDSKYETLDIMPAAITIPPVKPIVFYADTNPMLSTHGWSNGSGVLEESGVTDNANGWPVRTGHDTCVAVPSFGFR